MLYASPRKPQCHLRRSCWYCWIEYDPFDEARGCCSDLGTVSTSTFWIQIETPGTLSTTFSLFLECPSSFQKEVVPTHCKDRSGKVHSWAWAFWILSWAHRQAKSLASLAALLALRRSTNRWQTRPFPAPSAFHSRLRDECPLSLRLCKLTSAVTARKKSWNESFARGICLQCRILQCFSSFAVPGRFAASVWPRNPSLMKLACLASVSVGSGWTSSLAVDVGFPVCARATLSFSGFPRKGESLHQATLSSLALEARISLYCNHHKDCLYCFTHRSNFKRENSVARRIVESKHWSSMFYLTFDMFMSSVAFRGALHSSLGCRTPWMSHLACFSRTGQAPT